MGRYLSPDPLGLEPAPNPYAYPGNPLLFIDPLGLASYGGGGVMRGLDDGQLLEAINDPDDIGSVVTIHNDSVMQGNHRISEALSRMNDPNHPGITPDTEILVLGSR
ncbi:hypothetical protein [Streptomyces sp. NPDC127098]|uniref:hypothetical protein n=1 Tax=Streptomyces sp. NPDC127098 TaxID=3347137 RepID=UPI003653B43F